MRPCASLLAVVLLSACAAAKPIVPIHDARVEVQQGITVNGEPLTPEQTHLLAALAPLSDGDYWYDPLSGAAGRAGGPSDRTLPPNLPFDGPLQADASRGTTKVFMNGRELPTCELRTLEGELGHVVMPGRYFVDSLGYIGPQGGPPWWNHLAAHARHHDDED